MCFTTFENSNFERKVYSWPCRDPQILDTMNQVCPLLRIRGSHFLPAAQRLSLTVEIVDLGKTFFHFLLLFLGRRFYPCALTFCFDGKVSGTHLVMFGNILTFMHFPKISPNVFCFVLAKKLGNNRHPCCRVFKHKKSKNQKIWIFEKPDFPVRIRIRWFRTIRGVTLRSQEVHRSEKKRKKNSGKSGFPGSGSGLGDSGPSGVDPEVPRGP